MFCLLLKVALHIKIQSASAGQIIRLIHILSGFSAKL